MACKNICKLCERLIISTGIRLDGAGNLIVTIPEGSYFNGEKYCIVLAQTIPTTATINAPVFIQIGTGTEAYELVTNCCQQVVASQLRTRTKYSTVVVTSPTAGVFKLLGNLCSKPSTLQSINGTV